MTAFYLYFLEDGRVEWYSKDTELTESDRWVNGVKYEAVGDFSFRAAGGGYNRQVPMIVLMKAKDQNFNVKGR